MSDLMNTTMLATIAANQHFDRLQRDLDDVRMAGKIAEIESKQSSMERDHRAFIDKSRKEVAALQQVIDSLQKQLAQERQEVADQRKRYDNVLQARKKEVYGWIVLHDAFKALAQRYARDLGREESVMMSEFFALTHSALGREIDERHKRTLEIEGGEEKSIRAHVLLDLQAAMDRKMAPTSVRAAAAEEYRSMAIEEFRSMPNLSERFLEMARTA